MSHSPFASIAESAAALAKKEISSVELTQLYVARLGTLGREFRALRELTAEVAMRQAAESDDRRSKKKTRGILDGIPFGVKDLLATKGIPTRWGSPGHADQKFDYDSTVVERLQNAGGVLVGKLAMIELAGGGDYNVPWASDVGATLCAWDRNRWAGGSSSGSGSATALGCVGYSIGSETSGSIICPAAFNGVTGFRPTYGRVSRFGAMPLCWSLDKIGPIARSAEDCAIVLEAIAGADAKDPSTLSEKLDLRRRNGKLRIGILPEAYEANKAQVCQKSIEAGLKIFRDLGHEIVEVKYPDVPSLSMAVDIIVDAEGASAHENFIRSDRLKLLADPNQVATLTAALEVSAVDYLWAMRVRTEALRCNEIWEKCDCLFSPVFYHPAVSATVPFSESWTNMGSYYGPENLLGWPAMAFPIGFEDGAPIGGQIIAPAYREDICYQLARAFQAKSDWHARRPMAAI